MMFYHKTVGKPLRQVTLKYGAPNDLLGGPDTSVKFNPTYNMGRDYLPWKHRIWRYICGADYNMRN